MHSVLLWVFQEPDRGIIHFLSFSVVNSPPAGAEWRKKEDISTRSVERSFLLNPSAPKRSA